VGGVGGCASSYRSTIDVKFDTYDCSLGEDVKTLNLESTGRAFERESEGEREKGRGGERARAPA
jgi:hypothetical protein